MIIVPFIYVGPAGWSRKRVVQSRRVEQSLGNSGRKLKVLRPTAVRPAASALAVVPYPIPYRQRQSPSSVASQRSEKARPSLINYSRQSSAERQEERKEKSPLVIHNTYCNVATNNCSSNNHGQTRQTSPQIGQTRPTFSNL